MTAITEQDPPRTHEKMETGRDPITTTALVLSIISALLWAFMLFRWATFATFDWTPFTSEEALAELWAPNLTYLLLGGLLLMDMVIVIGLARDMAWARWFGLVRAITVIIGTLAYFFYSREFYGAAFILGVSGMLLVLHLRHKAWSLAYPTAFWLAIFFVAPMVIVFIVSLGERSRLGTVTYPAFSFSDLGIYFDDYVRFFSPVSGKFIYLEIFWRSIWLAIANTVICLLIGYPFAYWIARRPLRYRGLLIFLVMIPFWTNFLVRTYAWMLILRDSGLINNFWTISLHNLAVQMADSSQFFDWLAQITSRKLPLLFNLPSVLLGLFYGYLPFMVLPLYTNLERMDWSLLEAAADLGANTWRSTVRILLPLTMPGIVAGSIIVFIPTLGAYVTPDLMGGAKVSLLGNLLQQQFMTVRDWPFGSAIGFVMMAIMLVATLLYFRYENRVQEMT